MPADKQIRIAVIGAGANTQAKHIPLLQKIDGVTILGVVNRSEASSQAVAQKFGIPKTYPSWEAAVIDPDIDAIVVGTWPYLHCPITLSSLEHGKHILTEARMAMNATEAHQMLDASRQHPELVAQIVPSPLTLNVDKTITHLIESGTLGRLLTIECRHGTQFYDASTPLHWRQDTRKSGLNIMAMGIYYEAIMRWVGPAHKVTALGQIYTKQRRDEAGQNHEIGVPEHLDVLAEFKPQIQLHLQESAVTPQREGDGIWLTGSEARLRLNQGQLCINTKKTSDWQEVPITPERQGGWRVEEEFIRAIRGEETVTQTTFEDGVRYMEFTDAVHRSLKTGQTITLALGS